jgi:hypothetical protein
LPDASTPHIHNGTGGGDVLGGVAVDQHQVGSFARFDLARPRKQGLAGTIQLDVRTLAVARQEPLTVDQDIDAGKGLRPVEDTDVTD